MVQLKTIMKNSFILFSPETNGHSMISSEDISLQSIEQLIDSLRSDWELAAHFVKDLERELNHQDQIVIELIEKFKTSQESEHQQLTRQLNNEKQRQEKLTKMLTQQQENLAKRELKLKEYEKILEKRQNQTKKPIPVSDWVKPEPRSGLMSLTRSFRPKWIPWVMILSATGLLLTTGTFVFSNRPTPSSSIPPANNSVTKPKSVAALGYIEPSGEVIKVSAPVFTEGAPRVQSLLVKQGDSVKAGDTIAILDIRDRLQAQLQQAKRQVMIAEARLQQVKAGAKYGDIEAQRARYQQTQAELEGQLAAQRATILNLKAQLQGEKQAQGATVDRIKAELTNAQAECERYRLLHENGAMSLQEQQRVCLQAATTEERLKEGEAHLQRIINTYQNRINEAQANLNRTVTTLERQIREDQAMLTSLKEVRPVDIQIAQAQVAAVKADVEKVKTDLEMAYVRAPKDGQVMDIITQPGEMAGNQGIIELGQTEQMYVIAEVYETDIDQVQVGQSAKINSEGVIENLTGTIEEIGLKINKQNVIGIAPGADLDARVVKVKIRLAPEDSQKVKGLTNLQVNVVINVSSEPTIS